MISRRRLLSISAGIALAISGAWVPASALDPKLLRPIATQFTSGLYVLQVDLHEPDMRAESMQTPTLELAGWHHHNPAGATLLSAGTRVEVTGVFNYGDRGLFLELSKDLAEGSFDAPGDRPRVRVRIMVQAESSDPDKQQ